MIGCLKRWRRKGAALKRLYDEVADAYDALKQANHTLDNNQPLTLVERAQAAAATGRIVRAVERAKERLG